MTAPPPPHRPGCPPAGGASARSAPERPGPRHSGVRRICLLAAPVLLAWASGCSPAPAPAATGPQISPDLDALRRLMQLPDGVVRAEWQTGPQAPHGGDWWLAAVLEVPNAAGTAFLSGQAEPATFNTPPGLRLTGAFAALKAWPGALPTPTGGLRVTAQVHGVAPYARSPLLHGHAMRLSATQVLVVLWTQ